MRGCVIPCTHGRMSLRTAASAGLGEREDPRLKRRRLVGRSKAEKKEDKIKENNAQVLAHNMGEGRCGCTGERCECSSQLRPTAEDVEKKEYIAMSGQHVNHPHCAFNQFMCDPEGRWGQHFDMCKFPSNDQKFYAAIRHSGIWGRTRKGKRYYGRVSRPGEAIEDPSEAMDGRTERPADDRNVCVAIWRPHSHRPPTGTNPLSRLQVLLGRSLLSAGERDRARDSARALAGQGLHRSAPDQNAGGRR